MSHYIAFEHVSKKFGQEVVLQDVSFTLERGQICGMVGRNGSGKTVIFKLLCGLLRPDQGNIFAQGENITKSSSFFPSIGVLIEKPGFIPHYSGLKNLKVLNDLSPRWVPKSRLKETMTLVGLDPKSRKPQRAYSLGMSQKLGIAQALMHQPELLILDEPMNGLDEESVGEMRALLKSCRDAGTTILLSSHNREDIEALCDKLYMIRDGHLTPQPHQVVAP